MAEYMGDTNKQYDGQLIEEYYRLVQIRRIAAREGAEKTVELVDEQIEVLKSKLQSLELPKLQF